ncbi:hypothetical protein D7Z26_09365 [Cohnella endophytica]|uniref:Uncharacterized protein n=1 Tax=Cohnella endophytica TaxID=2419778 RepID=A0A494Y4C9_9BACL|nr:hypothetical protein D7Z26_09365 [Cohnella endophytica]
MKKSLTSLFIVLMAVFVLAIPVADAKKVYNPHHGPTHNVKSYTKKNGTHVKSYKRTNPNHTKKDNLFVDR